MTRSPSEPQEASRAEPRLAFLAETSIAACGHLPEGARVLVPALCMGLAITSWNRLRYALAERWSVAIRFDDNNRSAGSSSRDY
jgi:hypothetical protein